MSINSIENKVKDFIKGQEREITAEILSRIPDQDCQAEAERLRRPEKPKPTPEAREQASRLHAHANTLKSEVASIIEKDILPKIDSHRGCSQPGCCTGTYNPQLHTGQLFK